MNGMRFALWGAAAAVAVTTAGMAVAAFSDRDDTVLSQSEVANQLASDDATHPAGGVDDRTPEPSESTSISPTASSAVGVPVPADGATVILSSRAGTLAVRCSGAQVTLERWSPNPGYRVDDVVRTASRASVWFESDVANDVEAVATCTDGKAVLTENVEIDDHGGGDRRGGGSGGSGRG